MLYIYVWAVCICIDYIQLSGLERQGIERCWKNFAVFTCQVTSTREVHEIARFEANCTLLWATFIAVGLTSLAKKHRRRLNMHYVHYVHYDAMRCMWQIGAVWDKTFSLLTSSHHPPLAQVPQVPLVPLVLVSVRSGSSGSTGSSFFLASGSFGYICIGRNALAKLKYHLRKTCSALQNLTIVYNSQKMQSWLSLVCQDRLLSKSKGTGKTQVCLWCETEILLDSWYTFRLIQVKRKAHDAHGHGVRQWLILGPGM